MTEFNPHARVDINKVMVVDMFKTERKKVAQVMQVMYVCMYVWYSS